MSDEIELDLEEGWYKIKDSAARVWDLSLGTGYLSFVAGHKESYNYGDNNTRYFGMNLNRNPQSAEGEAKIYVPVDCIIQMAVLTWISNNPTTNENISLYIRANGSTDYLIATVGDTESKKLFINSAMNVPLLSGEYFEIKIVCPTWVAGPGGTDIMGNLFVHF